MEYTIVLIILYMANTPIAVVTPPQRVFLTISHRPSQHVFLRTPSTTTLHPTMARILPSLCASQCTYSSVTSSTPSLRVLIGFSFFSSFFFFLKFIKI